MSMAPAKEADVAQRTEPRTLAAPGAPGAPDLVTHLLRDHGLGFYSEPPVRATGDGGYDLTAMDADHREQHARGTADHEHRSPQPRG